jgi:hypothetical protein
LKAKIKVKAGSWLAGHVSWDIDFEGTIDEFKEVLSHMKVEVN